MTSHASSGEGLEGSVAFIGIGANIGDAVEQCRKAIVHLANVRGIHVLRNSSLYRTEPIGPKDQAWYVNAVSEIRTTLLPWDLLRALKSIEALMERRPGPRWGPREIDLDILLYGQLVVNEEGLVIPHPELHRRRFVLEPLCEIASYTVHPAYGISMKGLLDRLTDSRIVERIAMEEDVNSEPPILAAAGKRDEGTSRNDI